MINGIILVSFTLTPPANPEGTQLSKRSGSCRHNATNPVCYLSLPNISASPPLQYTYTYTTPYSTVNPCNRPRTVMRPSTASTRASYAPFSQPQPQQPPPPQQPQQSQLQQSHPPPSAAQLARLADKKKEFEAVDALQRASALFLRRLEGLADDCEAMAEAGIGTRPPSFLQSHFFC